MLHISGLIRSTTYSSTTGCAVLRGLAPTKIKQNVAQSCDSDLECLPPMFVFCFITDFLCKFSLSSPPHPRIQCLQRDLFSLGSFIPVAFIRFIICLLEFQKALGWCSLDFFQMETFAASWVCSPGSVILSESSRHPSTICCQCEWGSEKFLTH